ncbi:ABC transporter I family member 6, chloroplastic [Oryza glaberrima]|uniref:ABC transporter domain-containing protein n=1 Tax=Oryza glaberrima TaxID=4538 RepID=I1QDV3_ORYGL|nr:ABC transporter I family member 6, chloroplastic [Oryza glaberrima]
MAPPLAAAAAVAVSSSSPLFSSSSSRPLPRRHLPPSSVSLRPRRRSIAAASAAVESAGRPLLEARDLVACVKENGQEILSGVNLTIREGEIHALMGQNGSGKSTLMKVLAGHPEYEVTGGTVLFKGENLIDMEPEERSLAGLFMSFQAPVEIPGVNNYDFLLMALNARREKKGLPALEPLQVYPIIEEKVNALNMNAEILNRAVNEGFSGGERKRNEILQLSVLGADLALLDEIDSGLDVDALEYVAKAVNGILTPNSSLMMITHYQRLLDLIKPSYVHIMEKGKIVKTGDRALANYIDESGYKAIATA